MMSPDATVSCGWAWRPRSCGARIRRCSPRPLRPRPPKRLRTLVLANNQLKSLESLAPLGRSLRHLDVSLNDLDGLTEAMTGIDVVFNLAKSMDKTWSEALINERLVGFQSA